MARKSKVKAVTKDHGPTGVFVRNLLATDTEKTAALSEAHDLFQKFLELFDAHGAREAWLKVLPPPPKGRPPGPADQELTRQLLLFYRHWQVRHPELTDVERRRGCARMLHDERRSEFGASEDAIVKRLERLDAQSRRDIN